MTRRSSLIEIEAQTFVFDLDDTLYLERDFAQSGFHALANHFGERIAGERFASHCLELLSQGARGNIFNLALSHCGIEASSELITQLVEVYRSHIPKLTFCPDTQRLLDRMPYCHTGLITDGPEQTQRAKISALGLDNVIDTIIATGQWGKEYFKPHPRAYEHIEQVTSRTGQELVYIADNGAKDFVTPRKMGWQTVQILREGRVHSGKPTNPAYEADCVITSFDELCLK